MADLLPKYTNMVNNDPLRLIPYQKPPRPLPEDRKILGPRYHLERVQAWVNPEKIWLISQTCQSDVLALNWETADVDELLHTLQPHDYKDSEWCGTGVGIAVDCDAYSLNFDTRGMVRSATGLSLYVKFGFTASGQSILIVSCHS